MENGIKEITSEKADEIICSCKPLGKFYTKEEDLYVAIDNSTGDA